jgi:GT2 family glycosyltransferase
MRKPLVSAIIVTYNNKKWLERSIPSLLKQTYKQLEIIVVDNASLDQAAQFVGKRFPEVKVLEREVNDGFGAGNNAGIKVAKGKYVLIANEDMVFDKGCIERLVFTLEKDSSICVCQPTIYFYDKRSKVQSTGLFFNYTGMLVGDLRIASQHVKRGKHDKSQRRAFPEKKELAEIFSAAVPFLVRKDFFEVIGGFDEDFFLYFEEVDFCWRVWLTGRRVVYIPEAKIYHKGGVSTSKLPTEFVFEHSVRNRIQSFLKNMGGARLVIALIWQLLISIGGMFVYLIKRKPRLSWALCKAWAWNIWHFPNIFAKRIRIQRSDFFYKAFLRQSIFSSPSFILRHFSLPSIIAFRLLA